MKLADVAKYLHVHNLRRKSAWFFVVTWALVVMVAFGLASVAFWDSLNANESSSATIRNLALVVSVVVALPLAIWRSMVAARQAETAYRGLLNERYQKGSEMLGSNVLSVRLGGIYALRSLAEEHPEEYHVQIMRLFCVFVRHPIDTNDPQSKETFTVIAGREDGEDNQFRVESHRPDNHAIMEAIFQTDNHRIELYHRAECLTHVGDSQAVRSLTQCGEPKRFAMAAPIDLRNDFDSVSLRRLAKRTRDATQSRRLLALAEVYDGGSRTDASRIGGVGLQIIRDWVLRFNARGPDGLVDGKSPGAPSKLNADHRRALAEVVEGRPGPGGRRRRALAAQGPGAVALGDVRHLARRDHGRARVEGARLRQDLGAGRATTRKTSWPSRLLKKLPRRTGEDPGEAPERRRDRAVVAR